MYDNSDKRRLYELMDDYLGGRIDGWKFSDEFHNSYDVAVDFRSLTESERTHFGKLSVVAGRFTDVEDDLRDYPGTYFSDPELRESVTATRDALTDSRE